MTILNSAVYSFKDNVNVKVKQKTRPNFVPALESTKQCIQHRLCISVTVNVCTLYDLLQK